MYLGKRKKTWIYFCFFVKRSNRKNKNKITTVIVLGKRFFVTFYQIRRQLREIAQDALLLFAGKTRKHRFDDRIWEWNKMAKKTVFFDECFLLKKKKRTFRSEIPHTNNWTDVEWRCWYLNMDSGSPETWMDKKPWPGIIVIRNKSIVINTNRFAKSRCFSYTYVPGRLHGNKKVSDDFFFSFPGFKFTSFC